ncbi:hypothetical protein DPMN_142813 [Dreissena polymorpha]|uniref:Uncharacterized protein n=1 Tax=Dreissena polymorpha TaxID=45954 RepID=A0A9D4GCF3_DREPO|nr:hypothetical protein DPMN_142813 [Dreissena polymorpha]
MLQIGPISVRSSAGRQPDERKNTSAAYRTVIGPGSHKPYMDRSLFGCLAGHYNAIGTEIFFPRGVWTGDLVHLPYPLNSNGTDQQTDQQTGQKQYVPHYYIYLREKAPPLGGHVFHDIIGTLYRVFKRFFESRTIASTLNLTRRTVGKIMSDCPPCQNIVGATERPSALSNLARDCPDTRKNAPPPGAHVFEPTGTICELAQDIILTNLLTKFYDDGQ